MKSLKNIPQNWDFCIKKQKVFSLEEYQDYKKEKDLGLEEVFLWFWNMSEAKRYPEKRLDFFKEIIIESLEQAKKEGEYLLKVLKGI